jgi:hypothetical protein
MSGKQVYDDDIGLYAVIIAVIVAIFTLTQTLRRPLTTTNYVVNTNLYILLVILLVTLTMLVLDKYDLFNTVNIVPSTVAFIITIILVFAIAHVDIKQTVLRHVLWSLLVIDIAFLLFPAYEVTIESGVFWKILVTGIILIATLTYITTKYKGEVFGSWKTYLLLGAFVLVVYQLLDLMFFDRSDIEFKYKIYGLVGLILMSAFILYDTKNVYKRAEQSVASCNDAFNQLNCADYLSESLKLHFRYCWASTS